MGSIRAKPNQFGAIPDGLILTAAPVLADPQCNHVARAHREQGGEARESTTGPTIQDEKESTKSRGGSQNFGIEIKCPSPHVHVKYLTECVVPKEDSFATVAERLRQIADDLSKKFP